MDDNTELIMPFVTVRSVGGIHDDDSYVAGYEMGALDKTMTHAALSGGLWSMGAVIRRDNLPQADLIAMNHDYQMTTVDDVDGEMWVHVHFERGDS